MKSAPFVLVISLFLSVQVFSQVEDRFGFLNESEITEYAKPFGTSLGMAFNSASYHSAKVADFFGFSLSFKGMLILIPDDEKTFTPSLPEGYTADQPAQTIYGSNHSTSYYGPDGYRIYPPGIDQSSLPAVLPQISASFMGSEVMIRYLPSISLGDDEDLSMFGIGLKHNISRYIPLSPVDISVQFLYNNLKITGVMDITAYAFNAHASRSFGLLTLYGGLQYESSTFDLDYTFTDPSNLDPVKAGQKIKVSIDGDNTFRATIGTSLKLAVIVLNVDYSLGVQSVLCGGLTFEF
ncbi:MAG: hypothetical protein A2057_03745 [Ignavibacteria bacterium GWA2_35_9]|nr:MAG: hypothetical protein A2057_03745 [Ignavibacteria bacterium GWA2_35_9]OGU50524.1 MAG: hypothetical protein A2080_07125 [Ignavibacteria bacterium GWC2_36_12]OGV03178.1 MAG: hypothetical protein A2330_05125 [Ignavibacteria bacterium RIFOXYB2_FULL_36_7]